MAVSVTAAGRVGLSAAPALRPVVSVSQDALPEASVRLAVMPIVAGPFWRKWTEPGGGLLNRRPVLLKSKFVVEKYAPGRPED